MNSFLWQGYWDCYYLWLSNVYVCVYVCIYVYMYIYIYIYIYIYGLFWVLMDCLSFFPQVRGHNFKQCMRRVWCQGWGDWMAAAGELTSNMKVKWQAGHNKVSIGVSPFQTSQEQSGRKRLSQLLADVSGRMFHWQTRGRHRSLMVPLVTSNLHLAARENCNTPVKTSVCGPWQDILTNLLIAHIFSWVEQLIHYDSLYKCCYN